MMALWTSPWLRITIIGLLIAMCVYGLWLIIEPMLLDQSKYEMKAHIKNRSKSQLRIRFFSDYHAGLRRVSLRRITDAITKESADVYIFGGDLSSSDKDLAKGLDEIGHVAKHLNSRQNAKLYGVWGNHDAHLTHEMATSKGLFLLKNSCILVQDSKGFDWLIAGEEDMRIGKPDVVKAVSTPDPTWLSHVETQATRDDILDRLHHIPPERRVIVGHNPDQIRHLDQSQAHFFLSGHFHGGQIRLPFGIEYTLLRKEKLIDEGFLRGVFERNHVWGFISRGVGCVLFPFRFLARPEISTLTLYSDR